MSMLTGGDGVLSIGDSVVWTKSDDDVPEGSVGQVIVQKDNGRFRVRFADGKEFNFRPEELQKVSRSLREILEAAYLHEFVQPMEEKGLTCQSDIERELGLPGSLEESVFLESLGMKPVEAKRLRRRLEVESIGNGPSSMAHGGMIMVPQTAVITTQTWAVSGSSSPGGGESTDNAFPYWLGCANQGFCCCYELGGLCRMSDRDIALQHFDGALHRWLSHVDKLFDPQFCHNHGAGEAICCRFADITGSDHECCKQASSCVCCFCFESAGKSTFALAQTITKTEDALMSDEATDVNVLPPTADSLFALYSCCCTNCSIIRAKDFSQCLKLSSKGACFCYEGSMLCRMTFEDPTIYRFGGRASCFRCADLKGPRHACCKQTGKCACCFCFESENKLAFQVPQTCCLGWDQCCCCFSRCGFPPGIDPELPFEIACCGIFCVGGKKQDAASASVDMSESLITGGDGVLSIGDSVVWTKSDDDVPEGSVGQVIVQKDNGRFRVRFADGKEFNFKPEELEKVAGTPRDYRQEVDMSESLTGMTIAPPTDMER